MKISYTVINMKYKISFIICILLIFLSGCVVHDTQENTFQSISQEEAITLMEEEIDYVIIDVRTIEEYDKSYIPGAINIPVESIGKEMPEELPDLNQIILVYSQNGERAKTAAALLAGLGYQRVYEFGGIEDWKGEIVEEFVYTNDPGCNLIIEINGIQLSAVLADNEAGEELKKRLTEERQTELLLSQYENYEKAGSLPWSLPTENEEITVRMGDILLNQGDQIIICVDENTRDTTVLAHILGVTQNELKEFLGEGDVTATLFLEWLVY